MLCRARLWDSILSVRLSICPSVRLSVCLSVCNVEVCFSHRLEYFENNFTPNCLQHYLCGTSNMGYLVHQEHPQNWGWIGVVSLIRTKNLQYLQNGTRYDQGYCYGLIGTHSCAFDWYQNQWPWSTLKGISKECTKLIHKWYNPRNG